MRARKRRISMAEKRDNVAVKYKKFPALSIRRV